MSARRGRRPPAKGAPAEERCVPGTEGGAAGEHVAAGSFDVVEDPQATEPGKTQLPAEPASHGIADRASCGEELSRSADRLPNSFAPLRCHLGPVQVRLSCKRARLLLVREV